MAVGNPSFTVPGTGEKFTLDESGWRRVEREYESADIVGLTISEMRTVYDALALARFDEETSKEIEGIFAKFKVQEKSV